MISFIKSLTTRLRGDEFARNSAILTLGTAIAQGLNILAVPIQSRLYTPADFGLLALFLAVSSIVATSLTLRYETSIILPKQENEAKILVVLSVFLVFIGFIFFLVTAFLIPLSVKKYLGIEILGDWLIFAIILGVATSLIAIGTSWYNRNKLYKNIAALRVGQSGISVLISLILGIWGVATGMMMALLISYAFAAIYLMWPLKYMYSMDNNIDLMEVAKKHSAAPKYLLPTSLLDVATLNLPIFLITAWFSAESAGQFSMAWRILALPSMLVGSALAQVFYQRFSTVWPDSKAAKKLLFKTWITLAVIGAIPMMLIIFFGETIFSFLLGNVWLEAGSFASIIAPMMFLMLISSPTSSIFLVLGLQKYSLIFGVFFVVYRTGSLYFGFVSNSIAYGLIAWVILELCAIVFYNFIALREMRKP